MQGSVKQFKIDCDEDVRDYQLLDRDNPNGSIGSVLAITNDSKYFFTTFYQTYNYGVKQFSINTCEEVWHYNKIHNDRVNKIVITNNDRFFFTCSRDKGVKQFDIATHEEVHHYKNIHENGI